MVLIRTRFAPYKLILHGGSPVELEVTVKNTSSEDKLMSVIVSVPTELSLNSAGYMRRKEQRLGIVRPGEEKRLTFYIFPKPNTEPGEYEIEITALEHMDSYEYVAGEAQKTTKLKVVL